MHRKCHLPKTQEEAAAVADKVTKLLKSGKNKGPKCRVAGLSAPHNSRDQTRILEARDTKFKNIDAIRVARRRLKEDMKTLAKNKLFVTEAAKVMR